MKPQKSILTALLLFLALTVTAQQGINYKALIKDGSGNVLASSPITIQFIIYEGVALTNNVYQESHTVNTDANGIVIVNIGQGTTSNVFANINWGADQHFLNVQVNTGSGLVDMGTTEFMTVPYALNSTNALYANNTTSANNGLTIDGNIVIDNGGGWHRSYGATGWYNGTYGGGIYMSDTQWVRVYGNKNFLHSSGIMETDGTFQVGIGGTTLKVVNGGTMTYKDGNQGLNKVLTSNANGVATWQTNINSPGVLRASGNIWPATGAGVEIAYDPNYSTPGCIPGFNCSYGAGYVQAYNRDTAEYNPLFLGAIQVSPVIDNFTSLGTSIKRWSVVYAVNGTIQTSDRRMKKEIKNINYGLNTVMKLRPVSYKWKKGNQDLNLGLIAQEVQKLIPEVIDVGDDENKTLGMKYTELIPVLISAIQEQQNIIDQEKIKNQLLKAELTTQMKNIENLANRMEVLETKNQ